MRQNCFASATVSGSVAGALETTNISGAFTHEAVRMRRVVVARLDLLGRGELLRSENCSRCDRARGRPSRSTVS
jgi:hypothetical protein